MNVVVYVFRAFLNVAASGAWLLFSVFALMAVQEGSAEGWKNAGPGGAFVVIGLAIFSEYLAVRFWRHQPKANSSAVSAILNSLACLVFLSIVTMYVLNH